MFLGALVLKGNKDGCSAILNHIKDRNPLNYDHANLHPAKTANYMSGGHSVIRTIAIILLYIHSMPPPSITMVTVGGGEDSAKPSFDHSTPS